MNVDYNTETQEITVELNAPKIEMNTPTGGRGLKGDKGNKGDTGPAGPSQWGVITGSLSNQTDLKNALDNKVDVSSLSTVATSGDYTDLSNTPTIPDKLADLTDDSTHRVVTDTEKTTWSGKQDALVSGSNIKTINNTSILGSGDITIAGASAWGDLTGDINDQTDLKNALDNKVDSSSLSTVATSGDYDDLDNKPTIPTNVSDLNNDSGFISSETDPIYSASAASGITSTDITNWNGKSNFSGSYNDLTDKPTIPTKTSNLNNDSGFITNTVNNLTNYELKTDTGHSIELSLNTTTYVMTLNLKNSAGTTISTDTIDFPLESVVVNGSYDSANKKIILTLESGSTIEIPVADLISGLQSEITSSNMLSSDLVDDTGHTNKFVTSSEKTTWSGKQDALVSGTNIKTINNTSLLGSGNISIGGGGTATDVKINGTSITAGGEADILTETAYDSSTNKIATMSDVPDTSSFIDKDVNNLTNYSLTTTLQTNKSLTKGVEYIVGTQGSDTNAWTGTSTDTGCSSGTLYTGKMIMYHLPKAGNSSAATLNLTLPDGTTTGAKNIYRLASTTVTTNFAAGCDIFMVYDGTQWKINAYVDTSGSNTIGYQLRTNSGLWTNKTGYASNRYTLLFEVDGGLSGASTTIGTGTSKTTVNFKYIPGGVIKYYSINGSIANGSPFTSTGLWDQYTFNLAYTFNTGSTLTSGNPVYMRCTVNSDGTLSPNYSGTPSHPIVQALPSTADGKVYVYLGQAFSTTNIELYMRHPIYEYKNGKIREYVPTIAYSEISGTPTLATVATSGSYNDLSNKPTIPSVGNSKIYYGTSDTADTTITKIVTCSGFVLETGATISVVFTNAHNSSSAPYLNINDTGAKKVVHLSGSNGLGYDWEAGEVVQFVYDGTDYVEVDGGMATTTYAGVTKLSSSVSSFSEGRAATPYAVKQAYDLANSKQDEITSSNKLDYSLIDNTPTIPTVPTNVSAFTNDAGYLTSVPVSDVQVNGTSIVSSGNANLVTNTTYNSSTNKIATMSDLPQDSGWITITPTNGTAGTGYYVPQYRKIGKHVTMRGYITVKNNNAMFTLPEAYRPSARLTFAGTNDNKNMNQIRVVETGDVRLLNTSGTLSSGVVCFLDDVSYFVD